jgi:hypothetical protein
MIKVSELKSGYMVFGNKGAVWSNTCHISNGSNLCGNPALSTNWARIEEVEHAGCPECIKIYNEQISK